MVVVGTLPARTGDAASSISVPGLPHDVFVCFTMILIFVGFPHCASPREGRRSAGSSVGRLSAIARDTFSRRRAFKADCDCLLTFCEADNALHDPLRELPRDGPCRASRSSFLGAARPSLSQTQVLSRVTAVNGCGCNENPGVTQQPQ